jgi:hypothetical protein
MQHLLVIVGVYMKTSSEEYCASTCLPTYAKIVGGGGEGRELGGGAEGYSFCNSFLYTATL